MRLGLLAMEPEEKCVENLGGDKGGIDLSLDWVRKGGEKEARKEEGDKKGF